MSGDTVEEFLNHFGVKGQKWGVRKDKGHEGERAKTKKIAKLDKKFEANAQSFGVSLKIHNRAADLTNTHDVDRINNKPEYKGADFRRDSPLRQQYHKEHQEAFINNLEKAAAELGTNASGTKRYEISDKGESWDVFVKDVEHAGMGEPDIRVFVFQDEMGKILGLKILTTPELPPRHPSVLAQNDMKVVEFLDHHGVKGMKWGVRKDGSISSTTARISSRKRPATDVVARQKPGQFVRTSGGKKQTASEDAVKVAASRQVAKKSTTDALSNKQLQDAVTRMNLEQQFHTLVKKTDRRSRGQRFVQKLLGNKKNIDAAKNSETAKKVGAALAKKAAAVAAV